MKRAFSLVELMVAVAISGVVTAAATTATVSIYRSTLALEQASFAHEEAKTIVDTLSTRLLQVGGGKVRPWSAISNGCFLSNAGALTVVNSGNCSGTGGTRLDFLDVDVSARQLTLSTTAGDVTSSKAVVPLIAGVCPLTPANGFPAAGVDVIVLPVEAAGGGWLARRCVPQASPCQCNLTPLGGAGAVDVGAVSTQTLTGGQLVVGQSVSFEVDTPSHTLFERRDVDNDGAVERRIVSDRVFELRLQFGYDAAPEDGVFDGTWVTPIDTRPTTTTTNAPPLMRMARVGVIVGARVTSKASLSQSASVFGNTAVSNTGFYLKSAESAVTMRNLLVFF